MDQNTINNPTPQQNTNGNMGANNQNPFNKFSLEGAKGCFGLSKAAIIGIVVLLLLGIYGCSTYNGFVDKQQEVEKSWSQVENQYQRRIDLYKNIVGAVREFAEHEKSVQTGVTNARAGVASPEQANQQMQAIEATADSLNKVKKSLDPNNEEMLKQYNQAQEKLKDQMQIAIKVVHEAYPEIKADKNYQELQAQIEGTENRVTKARKDFIDAAKNYNTAIKRFPGNVMANLFGFKEKPYFTAQEGADKAPDMFDKK